MAKDPAVTEAQELIESLWPEPDEPDSDLLEVAKAVVRGEISRKAMTAYSHLSGAYQGAQNAGGGPDAAGAETRAMEHVVWVWAASELLASQPPERPEGESAAERLTYLKGRVEKARSEAREELNRLLRTELVPNMFWPFPLPGDEWKDGDGSIDYNGD